MLPLIDYAEKILLHCELSDSGRAYYKFIPSKDVDIQYKQWLIKQHQLAKEMFGITLIENIEDVNKNE